MRKYIIYNSHSINPWREHSPIRPFWQTNATFFEAKEYIARVRIGDSQYDEATKLLEEVLAVYCGAVLLYQVLDYPFGAVLDAYA